jgi:Tfp pilus assembly protein PilV
MYCKVHYRRAEAFTLVEVMVAATVMVLTIVGMIQVIVSGTEMLDVARKQTIATQIIHGQLDQIRLSNWTQVGALATPRTVAVDGGDQSGFVFGANLPTISRGFQCTRTVTDVRTDLKQVTFTVTWTGNTGRTYSRSGSTYVGRNGLYVTYQQT